MGPCTCWVYRLYFTLLHYIRHCLENYSLVHYIADLFKLFIILNYIYFAYMIYRKLWVWLKNLLTSSLQCPQCCKPQRKSSCHRVASKPPPCSGSGEKEPPRCCLSLTKPCEGSSSACDLTPKKKSLCTLFAKPKTPQCGDKKSSEGKRRSNSCGSSVERIQVEFNCKPKKSRKGRMASNRSCTKCGKNIEGSKGVSRVPLPVNAICGRKSLNEPRC